MASFQLHTDPLVTCPYNPAHRLKKSRMQIHLTKCQKNNIEVELKECPFNAQHRILPLMYQHHLSTCPDRKLVERQIIHASDDTHHGKTSVPSYKVEVPEVDEYWDDTPSTRPGYDPKKRLESGSYILIPQGQPVDRRNAYKKMFASAGQQSETGSVNQNSENQNSLNAQSAPPPEMKTLRLPKTVPECNLGRGQPTVRRKIAANIFGTSGDKMRQPCSDSYMQGAPSVAVGLGRGRGRPGHPPLAPGQVKFLEE